MEGNIGTDTAKYVTTLAIRLNTYIHLIDAYISPLMSIDTYIPI